MQAPTGPYSGLQGRGDIPLGCWKTPFSTPVLKALLNSESNMLSETVMVLFALTYFLSDCRLQSGCQR